MHPRIENLKAGADRYMKLKSIQVEGFVETPNIQNVYLSGFDHLHRYEVIEICIG